MRMKEIPVTIEVMTPVVLPAGGGASVLTASEDQFSGTMVRGILARRYIAAQKLGNHAEEDEQFLHLFFGALRFLTAYPVQDGLRAVPVPRSLQKEKDGTGLRNLLYEPPTAGYKALKGLAALQDGAFTPVQVRKRITLHMSRNGEANGRAGRKNRGAVNERLAGRSQAGGIYSYEAVEAGQVFCGSILGAEEDLSALRAALSLAQEAFIARAGRSRFTQYGRCRVVLGRVQDVETVAVRPDERGVVCLRLDAPLLPDAGEVHSAAAAVGEVVTALNDAAEKCGERRPFSLPPAAKSPSGGLFAATESVGSFVGVWGMRRPQETALAGGSVFEIWRDGAWTEADAAALTRICYEGVGRRVEEGFGQLRVFDEGALVYHAAASAPRSSAHKLASAEVKRRARLIVERYLAAQVQVFAAEDVQEAQTTFPERSNHLLSRLDGLLQKGCGSSGKSFLRYRMELEGELGQVSKASPLSQALRSIKVKGAYGVQQPLEALLLRREEKEMPYWQDDRVASLQSGEMDRALAELGTSFEELYASGNVFYAYLHAFFRYGRKATQDLTGNEEADV